MNFFFTFYRCYNESKLSYSISSHIHKGERTTRRKQSGLNFNLYVLRQVMYTSGILPILEGWEYDVLIRIEALVCWIYLYKWKLTTFYLFSASVCG